MFLKITAEAQLAVKRLCKHHINHSLHASGLEQNWKACKDSFQLKIYKLLFMLMNCNVPLQKPCINKSIKMGPN